jgi:hypothetical protein
MSDDPLLGPVERLSATVDHIRVTMLQDHELLLSVLKLLRGDEQGSGGITTRLIVVERQVSALQQRLDHADDALAEEVRAGEHRKFQIILAVMTSGVLTALAMEVFDRFLRR